MTKKKESIFVFHNLKIKEPNKKFNVYYGEKNGKSQVIDKFNNLQIDTKYQIKVMINKMAVHGEDYDNETNIRWKLKKYSYGELKSVCHRLFFFLKYENNIIFFRCEEKKKNSLGDKKYKAIQEIKNEYFEAFKKQI